MPHIDATDFMCRWYNPRGEEDVCNVGFDAQDELSVLRQETHQRTPARPVVSQRNLDAPEVSGKRTARARKRHASRRTR